MNPQPDEPMPQPEIDKIAALYREASGEQPPAPHDAQVLAAARAELAAAAKSKAGGFRKWRLPVAFAATLLLTVALTISVEREQSRDESAVPAPLQLEAPGKSPAPNTRPSAPARSESTLHAPTAAPAATEDKAQSAPSDKPVPVAGKLAAPAPAVAPVAPEQPAEAAKPQYVPSPANGGNARDAAPARSESAATLKKEWSAPPPPPAPASAPAPSPALAAPAPPPADNAQRSRANEGGAGLLQQRKSDAVQAPLSPQEWIDKIRNLRRAGRDADADTALSQFKLAFPDYPLPEDIVARPRP